MLIAADFDWNSANLGGISIGGGLLAVAVFIGPKIPIILDWLDKQKDKARAFARDKRREEAEMNNHLINVLKDIAVTTTQHTDKIEDIGTDLNWLIEYIRRGNVVSLPTLPPPPSVSSKLP